MYMEQLFGHGIIDKTKSFEHGGALQGSIGSGGMGELPVTVTVTLLNVIKTVVIHDDWEPGNWRMLVKLTYSLTVANPAIGGRYCFRLNWHTGEVRCAGGLCGAQDWNTSWETGNPLQPDLTIHCCLLYV